MGSAQEIDRESARAAAAAELERAQEVERLLSFDGEGRILASAATRRAARLELDTTMAYDLDAQRIAPGLSVKVLERGRWAVSGCAVASALGVTLSGQVVPVVDLRAGVGALWSPETERWTPAVVMSITKW